FFQVPAKPVHEGQPFSPGGFVPSNQILTAADIAYLKDRSLRFAQVLTTAFELNGGGPLEILERVDGRNLVATLTGLGRFGDDHNYATNQPSPEWNEAKAGAAYELVRNNV